MHRRRRTWIIQPYLPAGGGSVVVRRAVAVQRDAVHGFVLVHVLQSTETDTLHGTVYGDWLSGPLINDNEWRS